MIWSSENLLPLNSETPFATSSSVPIVESGFSMPPVSSGNDGIHSSEAFKMKLGPTSDSAPSMHVDGNCNAVSKRAASGRSDISILRNTILHDKNVTLFVAELDISSAIFQVSTGKGGLSVEGREKKASARACAFPRSGLTVFILQHAITIANEIVTDAYKLYVVACFAFAL